MATSDRVVAISSANNTNNTIIVWIDDAITLESMTQLVKSVQNVLTAPSQFCWTLRDGGGGVFAMHYLVDQFRLWIADGLVIKSYTVASGAPGSCGAILMSALCYNAEMVIPTGAVLIYHPSQKRVMARSDYPGETPETEIAELRCAEQAFIKLRREVVDAYIDAIIRGLPNRESAMLYLVDGKHVVYPEDTVTLLKGLAHRTAESADVPLSKPYPVLARASERAQFEPKLESKMMPSTSVIYDPQAPATKMAQNSAQAPAKRVVTRLADMLQIQVSGELDEGYSRCFMREMMDHFAEKDALKIETFKVRIIAFMETGDISCTMYMIEMLKLWRDDKLISSIEVVGLSAFGTTGLLLMNGIADAGKRRVGRYAIVSMMDVLTPDVTARNETDFQAFTQTIKKRREIIVDLVAKGNDAAAEKRREYFTSEKRNWFVGEELIQLGLADSII
jgi:ATP-dependent protease ClpP protease subunit